MPFEIDRGLYARMYGPTGGDRVRLGDANPLVGLEGRAALLGRLGTTVAANAAVFGHADTPRLLPARRRHPHPTD